MKRIAILCLLSCVAWAEGALELVDDFEDGNLKSRTHGGWVALGERHHAGPTGAFVDAAQEQGEGVGLLSYYVVGEVEEAGANAFMALHMGSTLEPLANLGRYKSVRFRFKTVGTSRITFLMFTEEEVRSDGTRGVILWWKHFEADDDWQGVDVPFEDLLRADGRDGRPDLSSVVMIAVGSRSYPTTNVARIFIDDVNLVRGFGSTTSAADTAQHEFAGITFRAPTRGWLWDGDAGTIDIPSRSTKIAFRAHDGKQPTARLQKRFKQKMDLVGMKDLKLSKIETLDVGGRDVDLYTATCTPPKMLTRLEPELAGGMHFEVLVMVAGDRTYQVECRAPVAVIEDLRPQLRKLLGSIRVQR